LEAFELARLNERANLRKELAEVLDEWVEVDIQARVAEWILVRRRQQRRVEAPSRRRNGVQLEMPGIAGALGDSPHEFPALGSNPVLPVLKECVADAQSRALRRRTGPKSLAKYGPKPETKPAVLEKAIRVA
ncbi:MAG: hypothetical protein WA681_09915, partial [Candidatus Acidiferrales bacterium]